MIIVLILMVITMYVYSASSNIYKDAVSNIMQMTDSTMKQIDQSFLSMDQTTLDILTKPGFHKAWKDFCQNPIPENRKVIEHMVIDAYKNKSDIRRVCLYNREGIFYGTGNNEVSKEKVIEHYKNITTYHPDIKGNGKVFLSPRLDFWEPLTEVNVITEIKPIKDNKNQTIGYIEVQQNVAYIKIIMNLTWDNKTLNNILFGGVDNGVFFYNLEETYSVEDFEVYSKEVSRLRETKQDIIFTSNSNRFDYRLTAFISKAELYNSLKANILSMLAIAFGISVISVLFIWMMSIKITKPVNDLVTHMKELNLDHLTSFNVKKHFDWETQVLATAYNDMTKRLREVIITQQKMNAIQSRTLFSVLQYEMSPHFLYNTLGSIANMCEAEENEKAADACYSLTEILRYASNYATVEVTLKEEIEHLNAYLRIMKNRYKERLEFEIYLDDELQYMLLPKLTLQPIVENAIKYSLMEVDTVQIRIFIVVFGEWCMIEIKDNGCGISDEAIEELNKRIQDFKTNNGAQYILDNVQMGGMGLGGTLIRLQLFFGDDFSYDLCYVNDEGGTSITLKIPIEK